MTETGYVPSADGFVLPASVLGGQLPRAASSRAYLAVGVCRG